MQKTNISSLGIILKTNIYKNRSIILDENLGKIDCWHRRQISSGVLISYNFKKKGNIYFLEDINIVENPEYWILNDIVFFHHILELCYVFLPSDLPLDNNIFKFITILFDSPELFINSWDKKIFIYHFFSKIGLISDLLNSSLSECDLDLFLINCINLHTLGKSLVTQKIFYNTKLSSS